MYVWRANLPREESKNSGCAGEDVCASCSWRRSATESNDSCPDRTQKIFQVMMMMQRDISLVFDSGDLNSRRMDAFVAETSSLMKEKNLLINKFVCLYFLH